MLFTTVAALLFPVAILAVPAGKPAAGDDQCLPVSYTLTEYTITSSPSYVSVSFNVQSSYTIDSRVDDAVTAGANCEADGAKIPSSGNECSVAGEKVNNLVFSPIHGSSDASYRIRHKWQCNGATWASINDIDLPPLTCDAIEDGKNGETVKCTAYPIIFTPQNARKLSDDDLKKVAGKAKATKPTAKSADCPKCSPAPSTS